MPTYSIALGLNSEFEFDLAQNDEIIWVCNKCDKIELETIFEKNWSSIGWFQNIEEGKKLKLNIVEISTFEQYTSNRLVTRDLRVIFNGNLDNSYFFHTSYIFSLFPNPNLTFDYAQDIIHTMIIFFFPTPIGEFINRLPPYPNRDVDTRVLPTINQKFPPNSLISNLPQTHIESISIYNDNGILSSFKMYTPGFNVFLELTLYYPPPSISPLTFLLLSVIIATIGFYIYSEKKTIKKVKLLKKSE